MTAKALSLRFRRNCIGRWRQSAASGRVPAQSLSRTGRQEAGSVGALSRSGRWGPGLRHRERRALIGQERQ